MFKLLIVFCLCFLNFNILGQFGFQYDPNIPVNIGGENLSLPWGGGLNYAQFSDFDFDYDGDMDLFIFDRSSDNIIVYTQETNGGLHYELAYNAQNKFPPGMRYRATMVDYDNDGEKDLFTYGIGGIKVYRNIGNAAIGLQWELYQDIVYTQLPALYSNLFVSSSDIPAILDVDNDGDIDVLTFHIGGSYVEYHKNQSMELYGIPDSLIFELKNECWGKFTEDVSTNSLLLNDPDFPCSGGTVPNPEANIEKDKAVKANHSGSTLLGLDYNNSGLIDLIIGDVAFTNLNLLINGGTVVNSNSAMVSVESNFPSNTTPSYTQLFPAAFYVDVDFDNIKDLIVCPNAKNISFNTKSVQFYKNLGTNTAPNFIFISSDFLQNQMIEHGTGSVPVFSDYNQDGLEDLLVANFYKYKPVLDKESSIALYLNTGTANTPEFSFIDNDIFNLPSFNYGLRAIPTFGDIDNDGDDDMFIGKEDGTLAFHENTSLGGNANYSTSIDNYQDNSGNVINVHSFCHPQLFDLDKDGLLDLVLGQKTGELIYYKNIGTSLNPSFELTNSLLGNIDIASILPDGYPSPHFFIENGNTILFLGSINGNLMYYNNIDGNIDSGESFTLVSESYVNIDVQSYSSFAVNDINNDGELNLFVGQDLGGVSHFEADPNSSAGLSPVENKLRISMFPNPANGHLTIEAEQEIISIQIYNMAGDLVFIKNTFSNKSLLNLNSLSQGLYIVEIHCANQVAREKLSLNKN